MSWWYACSHSWSFLHTDGSYSTYECPIGPFLTSCFLPHVQDFACPLAELLNVLVSPFPQPVEVALDSKITLLNMKMSHSFQFCIVSKLAEDTLLHRLDHKRRCKPELTWFWPLGYTANYWPPVRHHVSSKQSVILSVQVVFNLPHCLLILPKQQLIYDSCTRDCFRSLTEVRQGAQSLSPSLTSILFIAEACEADKV